MLRRVCITVLTIFHSHALFTQTTFTLIYGFPEVTAASGSVDPSNAPTAPYGMSLGTFTAVGLSANSTAGGRFSFTGWGTGAMNGTDDPGTFSGALNPFAYFELKLSPDPGYTLALGRITFDVRRSGTGPRNYCLRAGDDQFTESLSAATGTNLNLAVIPDNVFLWKYDSLSTGADQKGSFVTTRPTLTQLTDGVYLRLYAWNAESSAGSFSIDNFAVSGTITSAASTVREEPELSCIRLSQKVPEVISIHADCPSVRCRIASLSGAEILPWHSVADSRPEEIHLARGFYVVSVTSNQDCFHRKISVW